MLTMERKQTIVTTARRHFSRYGFSKTTMEEIARDCEITKPTLYNHFASKADLFRAVIDSEQNACYNLIEETVKDVTTASDKLYAYAEMQIQSLKKFLLLGELSRQAFLDLHPEVVKVYSIYRTKEEELIQRWVDEGIRSKEFVSTGSRNAARIFYLIIAAIKFDVLALRDVNSEEITADDPRVKLLAGELKSFVDLFLNGLRKRNT